MRKSRRNGVILHVFDVFATHTDTSNFLGVLMCLENQVVLLDRLRPFTFSDSNHVVILRYHS